MISGRISRTTAVRSGALAALLLGFSLVPGCHSPYVQTTVVNHSGATLRLLEVDYPSASFGTTDLAANGEYHYRLKIQGSGTVKMDYVDVQGKPHHAVGPELDEGQEGTLVVTVDQAGGVTWTPNLTMNK
jgi:hypothetical protein